MHVGLNLVFLTPGEQGGMETYARELLPALAAQPDVRVTSFVNRAAAQAGARGPRRASRSWCRWTRATGSSGCGESSSMFRGWRAEPGST